MKARVFVLVMCSWVAACSTVVSAPNLHDRAGERDNAPRDRQVVSDPGPIWGDETGNWIGDPDCDCFVRR